MPSTARERERFGKMFEAGKRLTCLEMTQELKNSDKKTEENASLYERIKTWQKWPSRLSFTYRPSSLCRNTKTVYNKPSWRWGTARHAVSFEILQTLYKWSRNCIWKALQPVQGHSRSPTLVPFDRLYDFVLVFYWNYVSILYRFRDINTYLPKFKTLCDLDHTHTGESLSSQC